MWSWLSDGRGAIIVAIIAALFALMAAFLALACVVGSARASRRAELISARTARCAKHAEFRQNWINMLREQMVIFQAKAFLHPNEALKKDAVAEAMLMILMLVDRRDPHYGELKALLYYVMNFISKPSDPRNPFGDEPYLSHLPDNPLFDAQTRFIELCQDILKLEWEATKKGLHSLRPCYRRRTEVDIIWSIGSFRVGRVMKRGADNLTAARPGPRAASLRR